MDPVRFNRELMLALGIDSHGVVAVTVRLEPGRWPLVTIEKRAGGDDLSRVAAAFTQHQFRLQPEPVEA